MYCEAQTAITTRGRKTLLARGGYDFNCYTFLNERLPHFGDDITTCSSKLLNTASWATNHSNYDAVVAYGYEEGGAAGYNDSTIAGTVAAFLIMRGQHWLFSIGVHRPCNPEHYPVTGKPHTDYAGPCNATSNQMNLTTAELLVTDYGLPLGLAHAVPGKLGVFAREYEKATVTLDCKNFKGVFTPK